MKLFNQEISSQLASILKNMTNDVKILVLTQGDCLSCPETRNIASEISELSPKLSTIAVDISQSPQTATDYGVKLFPAIVLLDKEGKDSRIRFFGIPAGHEINSFLSAILEVSGSGAILPDEVVKKIKSITKKVYIQVFVTLGCPHCPGAVQKAQKLALINPNITAAMIESQILASHAEKYDVSGVPKSVFNETIELLGDQPFENFIDAAIKAQ